MNPLKRVKVREMEITVEAVPLPVYWVKKQGIKFTYDKVHETNQRKCRYAQKEIL